MDVEIIKSGINFILDNLPEEELVRVYALLNALYKTD